MTCMPVVADGIVCIANWGGNVYALNEQLGYRCGAMQPEALYS